MAESQKTLPTENDPEAFLAAVPDANRREDARKLCRLLADWTGEPPVMWGTSIVGFGCYHFSAMTPVSDGKYNAKLGERLGAEAVAARLQTG